MTDLLKRSLLVLVAAADRHPEVGALATLRAAVDPAARGGEYYGPSGIRQLVGHPVLVQSSAQSHDAGIQRRLWTVSEELTGVTFAI